jgi:hypothetical protein
MAPRSRCPYCGSRTAAPPGKPCPPHQHPVDPRTCPGTGHPTTAAIDCAGTYRVWGCECDHCAPRNHPLDLGARVTRYQLDQFAAMSAAVDRAVTRTCVSCTTPGRLYPGGYFCDRHQP